MTESNCSDSGKMAAAVARTRDQLWSQRHNSCSHSRRTTVTATELQRQESNRGDSGKSATLVTTTAVTADRAQLQWQGSNCNGKEAAAVTVDRQQLQLQWQERNCSHSNYNHSSCSHGGQEQPQWHGSSCSHDNCIHSNCGGKEAIAVTAARAQPQSQLLQSQWTKSNYSGETTATTTVDMQQLPIQTNQAVGCNRSS